MKDCNPIRLKSYDKFIYSGPSYMVKIMKLRSELGCDTFTRKRNKISQNIEEEINCQPAFWNS